MVSALARMTTPETVRSIGAYPSFSIDKRYSPRAMRTSLKGDIPIRRRGEAAAPAPGVKRWRWTAAPGGSVVTEIVSATTAIARVIVGSPGK